MKTVIEPHIVTNEYELKKALDEESTVIYIENPIYSTMINNIKKSRNGKLINSSGSIAFLLGLLFVSGPIGWTMFLGGLAASVLGNSIDSLKDYSIEINEVRSRITLYRTKGKNRYKSRKHTLLIK